MMKNEGWLKLHRRWLDNPIAKRPHYGHLWVTLLLKAAHKQSRFVWNNAKQTLQPGQLLTGRKKLSEQTGIPESTVERILRYFENEHQIEQQKSNKFRIITIKNWKKYQDCEEANSKTSNKRTTDGQQMDTYNNVENEKNVKNDKKRERSFFQFQRPSADEVSKYAKSIGCLLDGEQFVDFYEAKDWFIGRNKMKDWKAAVRTWKAREQRKKNGRGKIYRTDTTYRAAATADGCIEI